MVCHTLSQHDALPIWFLPGLDLTVDYWDIDIKNVITQFSYATLIRLCVDAPTIDNAYCARVTRDPVTGYATRVESNQLNAARLYARSEEHTSELQSLMRISYDVFCLTKKTKKT